MLELKKPAKKKDENIKKNPRLYLECGFVRLKWMPNGAAQYRCAHPNRPAVRLECKNFNIVVES